MRTGPLNRLATTASLVFLADFAAKQWALGVLAAESDRSPALGWHLAIVNNTRLAGGLQSAGLELPVTAILTTIVVVLVVRVCRPLAAVDASAPITLGLLVGAGAANLADALIPPYGVLDFIALTTPTGATTSFNLADIVLAFGLVLCLRTMWCIAQTMRGRMTPGLRGRHAQLHGAFSMRNRALVSGGHALLAMCAFVWLYSMAVAWTPDAGQSAPNSLLCGVGVFAVTFLVSQARMRIADRRLIASTRSAAGRSVERVVLDGSIPLVASAREMSVERPHPVPRGDVTTTGQREASRDPDTA